MNQGETMGGTVEDLPTWDNGVFSKILREAAAAVAQHTLDAAALWASVFNNPELWLDAEDDAGRQYRPTEYEALKRVFNGCTGAKTTWARWLDERDADLYGTQLATLADVVADHRTRPVQLPLPAPLGIAAA
jgi:hypothetical protein